MGGAAVDTNETGVAGPQPDIAMGLMCLFQPVVEQIDSSVHGMHQKPPFVVSWHASSWVVRDEPPAHHCIHAHFTSVPSLCVHTLSQCSPCMMRVVSPTQRRSILFHDHSCALQADD